MRPLMLLAPLAFAVSTAVADEVVYNCTLNAAASSLTQATDVNAPFAGTFKGNYDAATNTTGTQTIPGFFGGSGNNPINYTASFVLAGDIVSNPTGALVVGTDIEALQVRVSGLAFDLLGGVPGVLGSTLNINYQTFRTVAPSGFFPGGVTVPIPLGDGSVTQFRATQTGPVIAGPLLPQKNGTFTFAVAVPVDFTVVATLLDQTVSDGAPTPGVLPLNGTLTVNEANNTVALSVTIANQSTSTQPVTTGQFTDLPLAIPTVIPAGGTANLLMSGAVTQVTLATNLNATLAMAGVRAPVPGDLNADYRVNSMDITICLSNWGASAAGDATGDGVTDSRDITVILSNWQ